MDLYIRYHVRFCSTGSVGAELWQRFKRGRNDQLWYFDELVKVYVSKGGNRIVNELGRVIEELRRESRNEGSS